MSVRTKVLETKAREDLESKLDLVWSWTVARTPEIEWYKLQTGHPAPVLLYLMRRRAVLCLLLITGWIVVPALTQTRIKSKQQLVTTWKVFLLQCFQHVARWLKQLKSSGVACSIEQTLCWNCLRKFSLTLTVRRSFINHTSVMIDPTDYCRNGLHYNKMYRIMYFIVWRGFITLLNDIFFVDLDLWWFEGRLTNRINL